MGGGGLSLASPPGIVHNLVRLWSSTGEHKLEFPISGLAISMLGPRIPVVRLPFLLVGLLAPLLFLLTARSLVSPEVSLFALLLYSVSWWVLAASRIADEIFFPSGLQLLVLWLLVRFVRTGSLPAAYFLSLFSGLMIYEYTSYHLVPILVAGELVGAGRRGTTERAPSARRRGEALRTRGRPRDPDLRRRRHPSAHRRTARRDVDVFPGGSGGTRPRPGRATDPSPLGTGRLRPPEAHDTGPDRILGIGSPLHEPRSPSDARSGDGPAWSWRGCSSLRSRSGDLFIFSS